MPLPDLAANDVLHVVVFGDGHGEAIVVYAPPTEWLIVDSVVRWTERFNPVTALLEAHGAKWTGAVLSHTHRDHAQGFVDYLADGVGQGPIGCLLPPETADVPAGNNRPAFKRTKLARKVERAIRNRWDGVEGSEWNFGTGLEDRCLGDQLSVRPLWPQALPESIPSDLNRLSTPLELRWHDATILLGADLPANHWAEVQDGEWSGLDVNPLKVAHHGSREAQHAVALDGSLDRVALCAPLLTHKLPDFRDHGGASKILEFVTHIHLSSFPWGAIDTESGREEAAEVQYGKAGTRTGRYESSRRPQVSLENAWQHVLVNPDGTIANHMHGEEARVVRL